MYSYISISKTRSLPNNTTLYAWQSLRIYISLYCSPVYIVYIVLSLVLDCIGTHSIRHLIMLKSVTLWWMQPLDVAVIVHRSEHYWWKLLLIVVVSIFYILTIYYVVLTTSCFYQVKRANDYSDVWWQHPRKWNVNNISVSRILKSMVVYFYCVLSNDFRLFCFDIAHRHRTNTPDRHDTVSYTVTCIIIRIYMRRCR